MDANELKILPLHEHSIERLMLRDKADNIIKDPVMHMAARALGESRRLWEQAASAWALIQADQSIPTAQRIATGRKAVCVLAESITRKCDSALSKLTQEVTALRQKSWQPPAGDPTVMAETRAVFRGMDAKDRLNALMSAADDDEIAAALLRAPAMNAGMTGAEQEKFRSVWRSRRHSEIVQREERLLRSGSVIQGCGKALISKIESMFAPHEKLLRAAESARDAAIQAARASEGGNNE